MTTINDTLAQRGQRYGSFATQAAHTQAIKRLFKKLMGPKWTALKDDQREALDMIANKLGRITNGDPHYADSWHDIAGYAQLVSERLSSEDREVKNDDKDEAAPKDEATSDHLAHVLRRIVEGDCSAHPAEAILAAVFMTAAEAADE